ncbi:MAG: hypothetical protein WAO78_05950 [Roseovarius sp.]
MSNHGAIYADQKIQVDNLRFNPETRSHAAVIILTTDEATLCLHASAPCPEDAGQGIIAEDLMKDAIRQVQRMPEFRRGHRTVTVCTSASTEFRQSA